MKTEPQPSANLEKLNASKEKHDHAHDHSKLGNGRERFRAESLDLKGIRRPVIITICWDNAHYDYETGVLGAVMNMEEQKEKK